VSGTAVIGGGLAAAGLAAALAVVAAVVGPRWRGRLVGILTAIGGVGGLCAGIAAAGGWTWQLALPRLLPFAGVELSVDALSGWFLALTGAVTIAVGVYTAGYADRRGHGSGSRASLAVLPVFAASMLLVPAAGSVATLLLAWELMAVTSLALVLTEHRHHGAVREAALWYAAMTQAGFVTVLIGLSWLAGATGTGSFAGIRTASGSLSPAVAGTVFVLCLLGFASKAGAVPLHPWLPRAHAEAPSHVSALMSAAMVKLGVYGVIRVGFDLLGGGSRWWWLVVAVLGGASALYGIVQAAVARDVKRLLAFSTTENIGLILLGVGFAGVFARSGQPAAAALAMTAALLHAANHAAFKTLLFSGAGAVVRATGTRDLDGWGGLARRMPTTVAMIAVGALAAAALPPGNGFVSEWLLLQALLHPGPAAGVVPAIAAPLAVAVVALTAGVAAAAFVKLVGTGLLARARSAAAARAAEAPPLMRAAMLGTAAACAALAVLPTLLVPALGRAVGVTGLAPPPVGTSTVAVRLGHAAGTIWPLWLAVGVVAATATVAVAARGLGRARRRQPAWACGDGPLTARMEYTATSFAEPLQRVFDDVLAPERDIDVTHAGESRYHVEAIRYHQRIPDRIENRLYRPILAAVARLGRAGHWLGSGSVHRYLAYTLTALIVVLVAAGLR
jgi:formate hydrogenlyase subunit 3/multisubunit Na+/H+ antiporter MnhD subunit